ncbi:MAG: alkaline phosphatase family protein, partial [Gemmataceae bacterium]|nr:alkaline phosphatase family protein [Gemmataceae bacterium]
VFDQMRGDYLERWADLYGEGGLKRLMTDGLWYTNCHYPYACTMTGPGHASLLTGCSPDRHGIVMNDWFERVQGKQVYCAQTDRTELVYTVPRPALKPNEKDKKGGTPERMLATGFADWLKESSGGKSKVVAVSLKDRSACLPGGLRPDHCYWYDSRTGTFVTSTWYRDRAPEWVAAFNARRMADEWLGTMWTKVQPNLDYEKRSGPDDVAGESMGISRKMSRTFPHPLSAGKAKPDKEFYDEVTCSPLGNDLLYAFAREAITQSNIGKGEYTDLLSISFSSNDLVGHAFGPDSQEVLDVTLNADKQVARLLTLLDERVGAGNYLLALTADHGICPLPEVSAAKGLDAKRLKPEAIRAAAEDYLNATFKAGNDGKTKWIDSDAFPWVYLNYRKIAKANLDNAAVAAALAEWTRKQPWAHRAYTRADIAAIGDSSDAMSRRMKKAYHPGRAGDVGVVLKEYYLSSEYDTGTTHGSPWAYDTHVPLVFFGHGMPARKSADPVTPQAIAAVFARAVGVTPAATIDAPVPAEAFGR